MKHAPLPLAALLLTASTLVACDPNWRSPDVTRINEKTGEVQTYSDVKELESGILKSFPDVPVPANFKIDLERSAIFTSNQQSIGKVVAEGSSDVLSIYRFYEGAMQQNGWSLVNSFQSATSSMYYAKPGKFVAIIIEQTGRRSSRVTLNVGPE